MTSTRTQVALRPMTRAELASFRHTFIRDWAHDLSKVEDIAMDDALAEATRRTDADLDGVFEADEHRLFVITVGDHAVGTLWFSVVGGRAFLDDITVGEQHRGNGYGRRALELMEIELTALGVRLVQLNVYAHNPRARALYERLGYQVTGFKMTKHLKP